MTLNGQKVTAEIDPSDMLAYVLRDRLGLTGTKIGCDEGECGACTVILDGQAVDSCILPAMKADGCEVTTVEGLAKDGELDPLQQAFVDKGAVQCGYCTPGLLMSARALLDENPHPNEQEVRDAIAGNLCRCTGYTKIVKAIKEAAG